MAAALLSLRVSDDDEQRRVDLVTIAKNHTLPEFVGLDESQFSVSILSGGITNQLYRVSAVLSDSESSASVVLRVFGKETDRIISRESELFYQALFLKTFCQGQNFLAYHFLDGYRDIAFTDMPLLKRGIAAQLANFHFKATLSSKEDRNIEDSEGRSRFELEPLASAAHPLSWWEQALSDATQAKLSAAQRDCLLRAHMDRSTVTKELQERLLPALERVADELVVGVCHNDLLCANIMRRVEPLTGDGDGMDLRLIDFEYSCKNYLLYDFANHFNEYVGLECDYGTRFPSDDSMLESVLAYRAAMRNLLESCSDGVSPFRPHERQAFFSDSDEEEMRRSARWVQLVKLLTLASNAIWAAWSVLQAANSAIDFDFAWYAAQRWSRYLSTVDGFVLCAER